MTAKTTQISEIWKLVLENIKKSFDDKVLYSNFFETAELYSLENNQALIITNTKIAQKILNDDYLSLLSNAITAVTETEYTVLVICKDQLKDYKKNSPETPVASQKKDFFSSSFIQPKYTFENFIVGKSNQQAVQSAIYVAKNPGKLNPLFLYSKSGLGKTHLLHAIGNEVKNENSSKKVLYITSEDFVDEFVKFVQGDNDRESLKEFFKSIDFLLIDDIQFLANKKATCTMFFNIFNQLVGANKQIVITSDRVPSQLEGLEERLVSRFSQGLSVSIEKPERKTLIEILKLKIKSNGFDSSLFDDDALEFVADNNSKNIRELEGALNRILFFNVTSNNTDRITLDICKQAFNYASKDEKKGDKLTSEYIISLVAQYYNLNEKQLKSRIRTSQIALARAIAMYLCRTCLNLSFLAVGQAFNGKDHTTVMAACTKVENLLKTDENMKKSIKVLQKKIKQ